MSFLSHTLPHHAPTNEFLVAFHSALPPPIVLFSCFVFFAFTNAPYTFFTRKHYHWRVVKHEHMHYSLCHIAALRSNDANGGRIDLR